MAPSANFAQPEVNLRAFHQMRCLCLLALIFIHCFSYSTEFYRQKLDQSHFTIPLLFLGMLNALFIFITGVTLRLGLTDKIKNHRLQGGNFFAAFDTFLILVVIETLKNLYQQPDPSAALLWDFIRTILCAFVVCYWVSRVHIYLNFVVVAIIGIFFSDIQRWIYSLYWDPPSGFQVPSHLNFYHLVLFSLLAAVLAYGLFRVWRQNWSRVFKLFLSALAALAALPLLNGLLNFHPTLSDYYFARTWFLEGITGNRENTTLMPLMAWGPSFLTGFAGTHLVLTYHDFFARFRAEIVAGVTGVLYLVGYLGTMIYLPEFFYPGYTTWAYVGQGQSSFTAEILKVCYFLSYFCIFVLLNTKFDLDRLNALCVKMGRSSYWIYLISTSWSPWVSSKIIQVSHSLIFGISVTFATTLLNAWIIAEAVSYMGNKRIRLKLKRVGN